MLDPSPAPVRPRVIVEGSGSAVLLEDLVEEMASAGQVAWLALLGPAGAGLTTALRHVKWRLGDGARITFADRTVADSALGRTGFSSIGFPPGKTRQIAMRKCRLVGWGRDEWIEYLLSVHKPCCASVMRRLQADPYSSAMSGHPALCSQVLDLMAADETLQSVHEALMRAIDAQFTDVTLRKEISRLIYERMTTDFAAQEIDAIPLEWFSTEQLRLIHIPAIRILLAGQTAWQIVQRPRSRLPNYWPRDLVQEIAGRGQESLDLRQDLQARLTSKHQKSHTVIFSLLHALGTPLRDVLPQQPGLAHPLRQLDGAFLDHADLSKLAISKCLMSDASFEKADFTATVLREVHAQRTNFSEACFRDARLLRFDGTCASFIAADMTRLRGVEAIWRGAQFSFANMTEAHVEDSQLPGADLSNAICRGATFRGCQFTGACLQDADFCDADFSLAILSELDLRVARFDRANFQGARMVGCCLEGMELPDAEFRQANLQDAVFTDSIMPNADFSEACLVGAKLANVDWERANLRGANLSNATFHMGSSRSGLVGSPIASYGSLTGFYTDELHEQDFKAPEEIRKANLRGADLRGAQIDNVDFYLVDLREALFDAEHEEQLRRTGAILCSRV